MDACPGPASPQTFHTDVPNDGCPECGPVGSAPEWDGLPDYVLDDLASDVRE